MQTLLTCLGEGICRSGMSPVPRWRRGCLGAARQRRTWPHSRRQASAGRMTAAGYRPLGRRGVWRRVLELEFRRRRLEPWTGRWRTQPRAQAAEWRRPARVDEQAPTMLQPVGPILRFGLSNPNPTTWKLLGGVHLANPDASSSTVGTTSVGKSYWSYKLCKMLMLVFPKNVELGFGECWILIIII